MDSNLFSTSPCGRVVHTRFGYDAYVPDPLPPPLEWNSTVARALERAGLATGSLDAHLQNQNGRFLSLLLRVDAAAAIRSEGRHVELTTLLLSEARGACAEQGTRLAANYVNAYEHALARLQDFPLSLRLIRELHYLLLAEGGDPRTTPGHFRRTQNWLGPPGCTLSSADFVPPPATQMKQGLDDWERYVHQPDDQPSLARLALAHHQFLVIHPFLDMNSATMALAASLLLPHFKLTSVPVPFVGRFMESRASDLQQRMLGTCVSGNWEEWVVWYLQGMADTAYHTIQAVIRLQRLRDTWHARLQEDHARHQPGSVLDCLFRSGATSIASVVRTTGLTHDETAAALQKLLRLGIAEVASEEECIFWSPEIVTALNAPVSPQRSPERPL